MFNGSNIAVLLDKFTRNAACQSLSKVWNSVFGPHFPLVSTRGHELIIMHIANVSTQNDTVYPPCIPII